MSRIGDALFVCLFGLIFGLAAVLDLCEWLFRGPAEEPTERPEPDEWEKLPEDDREFLRRYFR